MPISVNILAPLTDFFCEIYNGDKLETLQPPRKIEKDMQQNGYNTNNMIEPTLTNNKVNNDTLRIMTLGVSWASFKTQWRQSCRQFDNDDTSVKFYTDTSSSPKARSRGFDLVVSNAGSKEGIKEASTGILLDKIDTGMQRSKL